MRSQEVLVIFSVQKILRSFRLDEITIGPNLIKIHTVDIVFNF